METITLTLEYWKDEEWYVGRLRELPAVMSQGETLEALEDNIREAYHLMIDETPEVQSHHAKSKPIAIPA